MSPEEEETIGNLRAIIISSKGGLQLSRIKIDYRETFGDEVPLRKFGYSTLEDFFKAHPDNFKIFGGRVEAIAKSTSSHIASLVRNQKDSKRRSKRTRIRFRPSYSQPHSFRRPEAITYHRPVASKPTAPQTAPVYARKTEKFEPPPRFSRLQSAPAGKENQPIADQTKRLRNDVPLRQPYIEPVQSKPASRENVKKSSENRPSTNFATRMLQDYGMITRTVINDRVIPPQRPVIELSISVDEDEDNDEVEVPFESFEKYSDSLQMGKSRLPKTQISPESIPFEKEDSKSPHSLNASRDPFEKIQEISIELPSNGSLETKGSPGGMASPFKHYESHPKAMIPVSITDPLKMKQSAQSRIVSLKSSAQSRLQNRANLILKFADESTHVKESQHVKSLREMCLAKGLPEPIYNVVPRGTKNEPMYVCHLQIGDALRVSTYPVEVKDEHTARDLAAKKACKSLSVDNNNELCSVTSAIETENVLKLKELCLKLNLPEPVYKVSKETPNDRPPYFVCTVQLGREQFLTSPLEPRDEISAKELAAKKANQYYSSSQKRPVRTAKEKAILVNLKNLLEKKYGLWATKVPEYYKAEFKDDLPSDWFELVKDNPVFSLDRVEKFGGIVSVNQNYKHTEEPIVEQQDAPTADVTPPVSDPIFIPTSLKLPAALYWDVYVDNVVSSSEIWCRLIGDEYSEKYDEMMTQLEMQYMQGAFGVANPVVDQVYAINNEEVWDRVKLVEIMEDNQGLVFYIDHGEEEIVDLAQLCKLDPEFVNLPPQAIALSLHELDCFPDDEGFKQLLIQSLLGNSYVAEIVTLLDNDKSKASVIMWDTSVDDVDLNLNQFLLDALIKEITAPSLVKVGAVKEMSVSHVSDAGEIFVQSSKENIQIISRIINKLSVTSCEMSAVCMVATANLNDYYLTRYFKTGVYHRAQILQVLNKEFVEVKFIDYGYQQKSAIRDLFILSKLYERLTRIPPQAMSVRLVNINVFDSNTAAKIHELAPPEDVILVKAVTSQNGVTFVEIFRREGPENKLRSINSILKDKSQTPEVPARKKSTVRGCDKLLWQKLPAPHIPDVGEYFEISVTLAANPDFFSVQPLHSLNALTELMLRLQDVCSGRILPPPTPQELVVGELLAIKHSDNNWYRGCLHVNMGSYQSVYLCDFGDFVIVSVDVLAALPDEFKTFPYQAIRAKLHGIAPANGDWSADDCVYFQKLVKDKTFVSAVKKIDRDPDSNKISLELVLVDTATEDDIYIHKLLLDSKSAIVKESS